MDRATYEFSDLVINIQIMAAAIALPRRFWRESSRSLALLLGPVTLYMWLASSLIYYFVLGLSPVDALIVAACTAPTDPVLANSIVHGRFADMYIPKFIQQLLSAESTANDSIAAPLFYLATYMHEYTNASEALVKWTYMAILYEMGGAVVVGIIIGYVTRITLRLSVRRRWIDKHSFLLFELALAVKKWRYMRL